jgi:hypothetical protein
MYRLAVLLLSLLVIAPAFAQRKPSTAIIITSPRADTVWCARGQAPGPHLITWNKRGQMSGSVRISLRSGTNPQAVKASLAANTPNDGKFKYESYIPPGKYRINITANASSQFPANVSGLSQAFNVVDCRKPDLRAFFFGIQPGDPDKQTINARLIHKGQVLNRGEVASEPPVDWLDIMGPENKRRSFNIPKLEPRQRHNIEYSYRLTKVGSYRNRLVVEARTFDSEEDIDNNTVVSPPYEIIGPDLVACAWERFNIPRNRTRGIPGEVRNVGNAKSNPSRFCISIRGKGKSCYDVPSLPPGGRFEKKKNVKWMSKGTRSYTVSVDPNNQVAEGNEQNNSRNGMIHVMKGPYVPSNNPAQLKCSGQ